MNADTSSSIARAVDAASLIIYRGQRDAIEVLMGRRGSRASFAPSKYVLPGGILELADSKLSAPTSFNADAMGRAVSNKIHALSHTATREPLKRSVCCWDKKENSPK